MNDFGFRGTYEELKQLYPSHDFQIHDINGVLPLYRRSYRPPLTRLIRLHTKAVESRDFNSLLAGLQSKPELYDVIEIMVA